MNGLKLSIAALICAGIGLAGTAEPIMTSQEEASLLMIADETCAEPVVFIPLSEDVDVDQRIYAIVPASELNSGSAHLVTAAERNWLSTNGCTLAAPQTMAAADARQNTLN